MLKIPTDKKIEIGETILWKEKEWLVVADDTQTKSNNNAHPHWDYMLKRANSQASVVGAVKVIAIRDSDHKDMILDFQFVSS